MDKIKLTGLEKRWILYDVGNSAFTLLISTIIPIYFNDLAGRAGISEVDYLAYWGYAASLATAIVAVIGPVLGTIADTQNYKKPIFTASMMLGVLGCAALSLPTTWIVFLAVFVLARVGYSASLIFYDSMLVDVTDNDRMDVVSSHGYAWGYIGSCVPFVLSLGIVLFADALGLTLRAAMAIAFCLNAAWWALMSCPSCAATGRRTLPRARSAPSARASAAWPHAARHPRAEAHLPLSIPGVLLLHRRRVHHHRDGDRLRQRPGPGFAGLLLALLLTQIVAFPCALLFGKFSKRFEAARLIKICIAAYTAIALFAIQLDRQWEFWFLAVMVGMFQGAIQALSRSYFARIIPPEKSGEYFGIYDICGKGASFMGTMLVGAVAQLTGVANAGVGAIAVLFVIGFLLFWKAAKLNAARRA